MWIVWYLCTQSWIERDRDRSETDGKIYYLHLSSVLTESQTLLHSINQVPLIERNAKSNSISDNFEARELVWGSFDAVKDLPVANIVLISDCINPIYGEDSYEALAKTVLWIGKRSKSIEVFLAYEHRDGGGKASQMLLKTFFDFLRPTMNVSLVYREDDIDIYLIQNIVTPS